jgi:hypothetical protein
MTTEAAICSQAMVMCGGQPFQSLAETSTEAVVAASLYPEQRDWLFGAYRWRFAATMQQLTRLAAVPVARYSAAYQLPSDCLHVTAVLVNDEPVEFDRFDDEILCDAGESDAVILDYTRRVAISHWPPYFTSALTALLASVFAVPIAEDTTKAQFYEARFQRLYALARGQDAQGRTAKRFPLGRFARFITGGGSARDAFFDRSGL